MSAADLLTLCQDLDAVQACPLLAERLRRTCDRVVDSLPGMTRDELEDLERAIVATMADDYSGHVQWTLENICREQFNREE